MEDRSGELGQPDGNAGATTGAEAVQGLHSPVAWGDPMDHFIHSDEIGALIESASKKHVQHAHAMREFNQTRPGQPRAATNRWIVTEAQKRDLTYKARSNADARVKLVKPWINIQMDAAAKRQRHVGLREGDHTHRAPDERNERS